VRLEQESATRKYQIVAKNLKEWAHFKETAVERKKKAQNKTSLRLRARIQKNGSKVLRIGCGGGLLSTL
jgi:2-polyprenyl-3-methyl-5-hydroxy-6-metoxy-1,4-benzoquinol methylase